MGTSNGQLRDDLLARPEQAHIVQFYEHERQLIDAVAQYLVAGLSAGEPVVVIATREHRDAFAAEIATHGFDPGALLASGRMTFLDAREALSSLMHEGAPDPARFEAMIGGLLARVQAAHGPQRVRAYGEMVDLLWRDGNAEGALALEGLWNGLQHRHKFSLFCAYVMGNFHIDGGAAIAAVCDAHSHVLHEAGSEVDSLRTQARALRHEIQLRKNVEAALRKALEERLQAQKQLEALHRIGKALHSELDLEKVVQRVTDEATAISQAEFGAFFYNVVDPVGERYTLYTIAGVPRERFSRFPMPRNTRVFAPTFRGEGVVRIDDVTKDPRYGHNAPHHGMPKGHLPVCSYLAVPVIARSGEVLGGLFFGHSQPGVFTQEHEDAVVGIAAHAAIAIENARLYEAQKRANQAMEAARAEAEQANRAKDEFLAMLGHELRNPLSPIVSAIQLMRRRGDTSTAKEQTVIERQVKHLTRLVDDLLDVSRITRGKVELDRKPQRLSVLVAKSVEVVSPLVNERQHRLTVALPDEDIWIDADELRMCQVLTNLLTNAAKYTDPGGDIVLTAVHDGGELILRVRDNGSGIAADLLPRVFDLFVQGYRSAERKQGGLGIGLALVRNLVQMHGGSVSAASGGSGKGSEFTVRLPALDMKRGSAQAGDGERLLREQFSVTPRRILVVDDNVDAMMLLADLLRKVGHDVRTAQEAKGALEIVSGFRPEIAILDIGLPGMDGYELASTIRDRLGPAIRLMAVTGYGQQQDRMRAERAGFDGHFVKPVALAKLLTELEITS